MIYFFFRHWMVFYTEHNHNQFDICLLLKDFTKAALETTHGLKYAFNSRSHLPFYPVVLKGKLSTCKSAYICKKNWADVN